MSADVMHLLERANPVSEVTEPDSVVDGTSMLAEVRARVRAEVPEPDGPEECSEARMERERGRRLALVSLAASLVAILLAALAVTVGRRDDPSVVDRPSVTVVRPSVTDDSAIVSVPAPLEPFDKLEDTVGRLVASVNARDVDGVMAEFSDRARATLISGRG